jgi:GAF domain-containing protein
MPTVYLTSVDGTTRLSMTGHTPAWEVSVVRLQQAQPKVPGAGEPVSAELIPWLDAIAEITRATHRGAPLDELLHLIAGATSRLTGYDFCAVLAEDPERRALIIKGSYGLSPEYVNSINAQTPIPVGPGDAGEGPSSRAFRSQRPTTVADFLADPASRTWETIAARQGYSSLLSVPITAGQAPFGTLNCYAVEKRDFTAREIILMESMANQAGLAIETTRLLEEVQQRASQQAKESATLREELNALQDADLNHSELLGVVLKGGGPTAIARALAEMLRCTVLIDDAAGRLLAAAGGTDATAPRKDRFSVVHDLARRWVVGDANLEVLSVPPAPGEANEPAGLVAPVILDEEMAGHLWALRPSAPFDLPHRRALVRAAAIVAMALLKERTAQEVEWRLSRDFFDDLLDTDPPAADALYTRARQLGTDLTQRQTVLVVRRDAVLGQPHAAYQTREANAQRSLLSLVQRAGAPRAGATLTAARSDHVVILWQEDGCASSATKFAHFLRREIQAYAAGWTATICVGPVCDHLAEYGDAYRLACGVIDLVQQSGRGDRVVSLDTIGAYRLLLQVKQPRELEAFARATLGKVHSYDGQHATKLVSTLRCYMEQHCSMAATAKLMHVHPNTVGYRLRRVEKLLGVKLGDPQALLNIQLALMVEGILGDDRRAAISTGLTPP